MNEPAMVQCPYCFEMVEVWLEADVSGELIFDCEVCCHPWLVRVHRDLDGNASYNVERAQ